MKVNPEAKRIGEVVVDELADIAMRRGETPRPYDPERWEQECHEENLAGIAISGGGIRSATFALGALQGLAKKELLQQADYCSTVSGGGYIGSWLQGVLARFKSYDPLLKPVPGPPAKDPITFLRKYSSYLAPRMGLSLDALVIPVLWLRNTALNQAIIVSAFLALSLMTLAPGALLRRAALSATMPYVIGFTAGAIALACVAVAGAASSLRKIVHREFCSDGECEISAGTDHVLWKAIVPITLATVFMLFAVVAKMSAHDEETLTVVALVVPAALHFLLQMFGGFPECYGEQHPESSRAWPWIHAAWMAPVSGLALSGMVIAIYRVVDNWNPLDVIGAHQTMAWGPPLLLGAIIVSVSLHIGLMGRDFPDATREWLGRAGAFLVSVAVTWAAVFAIAVFGPHWIGSWWLEHGARLFSGASAWVLTTLGTVLAGRSAKTGEAGQPAGAVEISLDVVARYGPFVAIGGFLVSVAFVGHAILYWPVAPRGEEFLPNYLADYWSLTEFSRHGVLLWAALWTFNSVLVASVLSWRVNINEFSLHHFYKNRLVRCYMGASKSAVGGRCADSFTGFDPKDDIPMSKLAWDEEKAKEIPIRIPYPIVNACLNITAGSELATQQRKAVSWTFTPRHSGFVPRRSDADRLPPEDANAEKGFVASGQLLGGVGLGTAMAISGAAVNPGMGYHSSPQTAFLLTLFDVRLGWWTGNPRNPDTYRRPAPLFALRWLFRELTGSVDSRAAYLNLSDGGHFENLGLYELVRRRCKYIVAINAEEDRDYTFQGLGSAIRKVRADFGVEIEIDPRPIRAENGNFSKSHYAIGRIRYPEAGSTPGYLLYLQSSITGDDEPADVEEYRREFPQFPQQSTGNQFFTEAQFESYRRLGLHVTEVAFEGFEKGDYGELFTFLAGRKAAAASA
jgi:hypothetical protein